MLATLAQEFTDALGTMLAGDAALAAAFGASPVRIDATNSVRSYPRISIGRDEHRDVSGEGQELDEITMTLDIWTRDKSRIRANAIKAVLLDILPLVRADPSQSKFINTANFTMVNAVLERASNLPDPDDEIERVSIVMTWAFMRT